MFEEALAPVQSRLKRAGVKRLGLFGSFSKGKARPDSDVDVYVEFIPDRRTFDSLNEVYDALELVFDRKIDLVTGDSLSPYIGPSILTEVQYVDLYR